MNHFRTPFSLICALAATGCGAAPGSRAPEEQSASSIPAKRGASAHDWTRFGWDAGRSSASRDETGITAANVATMRRQQVTIDESADASAI
jgi:hypothetical protein